MKYIIYFCSLIIVCVIFSTNVLAIDDEPTEFSCDRVSSVLLKTFKNEYTGKLVTKRIRVDTRNISAQGNIIALHIKFCEFLEKHGYKRKIYQVRLHDVKKKRKDRWVNIWVSNCQVPVSEILLTTRVIEIEIEGNEYHDSFYRLQEGDSFRNHHSYRNEGHSEFFRYILKKHKQELKGDYNLVDP